MDCYACVGCVVGDVGDASTDHISVVVRDDVDFDVGGYVANVVGGLF